MDFSELQKLQDELDKKDKLTASSLKQKRLDKEQQSPQRTKQRNSIQSTSLPSLKTQQEEETPQSHIASNTAIRQVVNTATKISKESASQHDSKPTEKVTYRFHPQGVKAINEIKWLLLNDYEIKADLAKIAEEAILIVHKDLLARRQDSNIVLQLNSKTASRKKG